MQAAVERALVVGMPEDRALDVDALGLGVHHLAARHHVVDVRLQFIP